MKSGGSSKGGPVGRCPTGVRSSVRGGVVYNVCGTCGTEFVVSGSQVAHCLKTDRRPVPAKTPSEEKKEQGATGGTCESSFRTMLREGNKILERVTRNVAFATEHFFGDGEEEEEDIDRVVEEFKKAQLEKEEKNNKR